MLDLEEIKRRLHLYNIMRLSEDIGIHFNTLYKIQKGISKPSHETYKKLSDYMENKIK